jgi:uncharacterized protein with von Willebrand factor type A (vWA) domain
MRRALLGAAIARGSHKPAAAPVTARVALPDVRDRRATVLRAAGGTPLLFEGRATASRARRAGQTHVYLDVSGSMEPYIDYLYGALIALRQHLAPGLHLFSTAVQTIDLRALGRGVCETTCGTDIGCVLDHAATSAARKLLLVTDGYVGPPADAQMKRLRARGQEVRVLLTPRGWRKDLERIAARIEAMPELEGERR